MISSRLKSTKLTIRPNYKGHQFRLVNDSYQRTTSNLIIRELVRGHVYWCIVCQIVVYVHRYFDLRIYGVGADDPQGEVESCEAEFVKYLLSC